MNKNTNKHVLYSAIIEDYYHNPRHQGVLDEYTVKATSVNPACGDSVMITARLENGVLVALAHQGKGCMISQAVASLLVDKVLAQDPMLHAVKIFKPGARDIIEEIRTLTGHDIISWIGIPLGPNRLKCAVLALEALQKGLEDYARSH